MPHDDLVKEIQDAIDFSEHANKPPALRVIGILGDILSAACALADHIENERVDEVADAAEYIFDDFLVPIDLPVNDWLEGFVESQMRAIIRPVIRQAFGELNG